MADTINELYSKYTEGVEYALEDDRYFQYLFEMIQAGDNTLEQKNRILEGSNCEREKQLRSFSLQIERKLGCSEINSKAPLSGQNAKTAARRRRESGGENGRRFFRRCRMGCSANAVPVKRFCTKRMCATAGTAVRNVARAFGSIHRPGFG